MIDDSLSSFCFEDHVTLLSDVLIPSQNITGLKINLLNRSVHISDSASLPDEHETNPFSKYIVGFVAQCRSRETALLIDWGFFNYALKIFAILSNMLYSLQSLMFSLESCD